MSKTKPKPEIPAQPPASKERLLLARIAHCFIGMWRSDLSPQECAATNRLIQAGYLEARDDHQDSHGILELSDEARELITEGPAATPQPKEDPVARSKAAPAAPDTITVTMTRAQALALLKAGNLGIDMLINTLSNVDPIKYPGLIQEQNELIDQANSVLITMVQQLGK